MREKKKEGGRREEKREKRGEKREEERKERRGNRSPKGNMWSAIPVVLLCLILNWSEGKQGSGPEGEDVL